MQVPAPFEYERATSVDHAIALLERLGGEARLVAGGHSLLPMMKLRLANLEYLIDINDLHDELGYVRVEPDEIRIGAMTRHRELLESDELAAAFPIFRDAERVIADPVVRNRGTLGGSLCQADPSEDLSAVCTTLDASCVIRGSGGERVVPMEDFHRGPYETAVGDARDPHRDPHPPPPGGVERLREGRAAGRRLGHRLRRRRGVDGRRHHQPTPGSAWPPWGPNTTGIPAISEAPARPGARPRSCSPQAGALAAESCDPPPTCGAAPSTSATSPRSSPDERCADPSPGSADEEA